MPSDWSRRERSRKPVAPTPRATGFLILQGVLRAAEAAATLDRMVRKVLLASPRGYCAGVERAVETVERALELYGPPVYVRKQIVHNLHVVRDLEARGAIFVEDEDEVPVGETVVFSAHGVAPSVHENSAARQPAHDRRDLPARDQGAHAGAALCGRRATP